MKAYKGFDKNLQCRGFQYEIGKTYEYEGIVSVCNSGFHACEYPLDVFNYYSPLNSRYCEVECDGDINNDNNDTKLACRYIKIGTELSLSNMINAAVKFVFDKADWKQENHVTDRQAAASATGYMGAASATGYMGAASATGDMGAASATGDMGAASATGYMGAASATGDMGTASATGYRGAASATGYRGAASATGKHSVACGLGVECKAKGAIGCGIVLVEREWSEKERTYTIKNIKAAIVDGETIKADTWYKLVDGEFVECE